MDVMLFSSEHKADGEDENPDIKYDTRKSLDDEHTPGVFNVSNHMLCADFIAGYLIKDQNVSMGL